MANNKVFVDNQGIEYEAVEDSAPLRVTIRPLAMPPNNTETKGTTKAGILVDSQGIEYEPIDFAPPVRLPDAPDDASGDAPDAPGFLGTIKDYINLADTGVYNTLKTFTDAVGGAGNVASEFLEERAKYEEDSLSPYRRQLMQLQQQLLNQAEGQGLGAEVGAAWKAFKTAPGTMLAQGVGSVLPFVGATIAGGIPAAVAAGAVSGAGAVKGTIYDAVRETSIAAGVPEEKAEQLARESQAYFGGNTDQIAIGAGIGALASRLGVEKSVAGAIGRTAASRGVTKSAAKGFVEEAATEAAQEGQEKLAGNIALKRAGYDNDIFRGTASAATLGALTGGPLGGTLGAVEGRVGTVTAGGDQAAAQARKKVASTIELAGPANGKYYTAEEAATEINKIVGRWTNPPEIEVVDTVDDIADPDIREEVQQEAGPTDVLGFYGRDGKVRIIAGNITNPADLKGVLFHEALGHYGLAQQFRNGLNALLRSIYRTSLEIQQLARDWVNQQTRDWSTEEREAALRDLDANPELAVEEVLASLSEGGPVVATMLDKIKNYIKSMARKAGMKNVDYSVREVQTILAQAHARVISGKAAASPSSSGVTRFLNTWHGSPVDEFRNVDHDNPYGKFDDAFIGTGEGAQAFSWGHYVAMRRRTAEEKYRFGLLSLKGKEPKTIIGPNNITLEEWAEQNAPNYYYLIVNTVNDFGIGKKGVIDAINYLETPEHRSRKQGKPPRLTPYDQEKREAANILKQILPLVVDMPPPNPLTEEEIKLVAKMFRYTPGEVSRMRMHVLREELSKQADFHQMKARDFKKEAVDYDNPRLFRWAKQEKREELKIRALLKKYENVKPPGSTFEVEIPDPKYDPETGKIINPDGALYLNWDGPVAPEVLDAFKRLGINPAKVFFLGPSLAGQELYTHLVQKMYTPISYERYLLEESFRDTYNNPSRYYNDKGELVDPDGIPGPTPPVSLLKELKRLSKLAFKEIPNENAPRLASKALSREGVVGTQFRDGFSRNKNKNITYNFVIYDPKDMKIINKFSKRSAKMIGGINFEKLRASSSIKKTLREAAEQIDTSGRGTTHREIVDAARAADLLPEEFLKLKPGIDAVDITGGRMILLDLAGKVNELSWAIRNNEATTDQELEFLEHVVMLNEVMAHLSKTASTIGRTLNALGITLGKARRGGFDLRYALKDVNLGGIRTPEDIRRLAELIGKTEGNPQQIITATTDSMKPHWEDYVTSVRYSAMLSGIGTPVKAIIGTISNMALASADLAVAAAIGKLRQTVNPSAGGEGDRVSGRELAARAVGLWKALSDWATYRRALESYREGIPLDDTPDRLQLDDRPVLPGSMVTEYPRRLLSAIDTLMRPIIVSANAYGLATRQALKEGLEGAELSARVENLLRVPTREELSEMSAQEKAIRFYIRTESKREADIAQLLDGSSPFVTAVSAASRRKPDMSVEERVFRFGIQNVFLFMRNAVNIAEQLIRHTPALGLIQRRVRDEWVAGGATRDIVVARWLVGGGIISFAAYLAVQGLATGEAPDDPDKRAQNEALGIRPRSIKVGDEWRSYDGFDAIGLPFSTTVSIVEKYRDGSLNEEGALSAIASAMAQAGSMAVDEAFGKQLYEFLLLFNSDARDNDKANYAATVAASFVPAIVRQATQYGTDTAQRVTSGDGSIGDRVKGRVMSALPGLSESLPQKVDIFGRPISRETDPVTAVLGIGRTVRTETDPTVLEVRRLAKGQPKAIIKEVPVRVGDRRLTAEERTAFQAVGGRYFYEDLKEAMQDPVWPTMTDDQRREEIRLILQDAYKDAREELFPKEE